MREILFRGKRVDTDEWVYGVPLFEENRCYMIEDLFICDEYQCTGAVNSIVDPETVGQYTGLTDNNGNKIFEGDIVSDTVDVYTVVFDEQCRFMMTGEYDRFLVHCDEDCFVLGNVFDNPELLEVGK